jgi:hypothetical protein
VLLSIFVHGFSALPGMALYARAVGRLPPGAPENECAASPVAGPLAHGA